MITSILLFVPLVIVLVALLVWSLRPQPLKTTSPEQILQALAEERHYSRLPQISRCLRSDDIRFLEKMGNRGLLRRVQTDRKRIALDFLDALHRDFESLLQAAALLATMAPELAPVQEWERLKLSVRFALHCRYLRWKLQFGLAPWTGFGRLSDMASAISMRLEAATAQIGENAVLASRFSALSGRGSSDVL